MEWIYRIVKPFFYKIVIIGIIIEIHLWIVLYVLNIMTNGDEILGGVAENLISDEMMK
jgi:hypothetical protein